MMKLRFLKSRKILSFLLLFMFLINSFPTKPSAVEIYPEIELKQIVYANLRKVSTRVTGYSTQKSVFNNLRNIAISALWVQFINENEGPNGVRVSFNKAELDHYYVTFKEKVNDFNANAKDGKDYIKVTLPAVPDSYSEDYLGQLLGAINYYMNSYFKHVKTTYDGKSDSEKSDYLAGLTLTILAGYEVMLKTSQEYNFMRSVSLGETSLVDFSAQTQGLFSTLNNAEFKFAYDVALKQIEKGVNIGSQIKLSGQDDLIGKFTELDETGKPTNKVNKAYLAVVASSSIYKPMESRLGEDEFITALSSLVGDDSEILETYSQVAYYKKPLYIVDYNSKYVDGDLTRDSKYFKSTARRASLGALVEMIREKKDGALITMQGSFELSEEDEVYVSSEKNKVGIADNGDNAGDYVDPETGETLGEEKKEEEPSESTTGADNSNIPNTEKDDEKKEDEEKKEEEEEKTSNGADASEELYIKTKDGNKSVALTNEIDDSTFFTEPLLMFSRKGLPGINFIMLNNIFAENNGKVSIDDNKDYNVSLYITPFGDIVTGDNLVVIPASANATYYSLDPKVVYDPFTDAFMDNYPSIASSKKFKVSSKDTGKLMLAVTGNYESDLNKLKESYAVTYPGLSQIKALYIKGDDDSSGVKSVLENNINPIDVGIYDPASGEKYNVFTPQKKDLNFTNFMGNVNKLMEGDAYYTIDTNVLTSDGVSVPLYPFTNATGEEAIARNRFIVQAFYAGLVLDSQGAEGNSDNGRFDTEYLKTVLVTAMDGKTSVVGYEKGIQNDLANSEDSSWFGFITDWIKWLSDNIIKLFGSAPGMLGLRSATQDTFMGKFLYYCMTSMPFLIIILVVVMMALYTRERLNIVTSVVYTGIGAIGLFILIYLAPKYLSDITNFLPNNGSNKLAYDGLLLRQEVFTEKSNVQATYSNFGKFGFAESSITLYAFKDDQLKEVCEQYGKEVQTIMSGGSFVIDENSGLFVQGNKLKISLDKLMNASEIETRIDNKSNKVTYKLEKKEYIESVINYYTPYNVIMDGLIEKLNHLSDVYLLSRNQLPYPNGVRKDAFFMDSYVNSPIFTSPTNPRQDDEEMTVDTEQALESLFMPYGEEIGNMDWLGFNESFRKWKDSDKIYDSIWYQTMEQNHYFSEEMGEELYSNLVVYVNQNTKEWLLKNIDKLPYISDETLVEVTSLYATMLFNTQVSQFYNKLYPERINYEELSVVDTLRPIITKDYNKFSEMSRDLTDYVDYEFGIFGLIGFCFIIVLQGITSLILTYSTFIMYLLLILFILIRIIIKKDSMTNAVMGFLKLYAVLVGVYFVNVLMLQIINKFDSTGLSIFFTLMLSIVVSGMSCSVVFYTITGFSTLDFANERSFKGMFNVLNKLSFGTLKGAVDAMSSRVGSIFSKSFNLGNRKDPIGRKVGNIDLAYSKYADSKSLDDYIERRYGQYKDIKDTDEFYRRDFELGRGKRMKRVVEFDLEDDGDYLT